MGRRANGFRLTAAKKRRFLEFVAEGKTLEEAAREVGLSRRTFFDLRDPTDSMYDEQFARDFADAYAHGTGVMVEHARRLAVDGVDEPVFQGGKQVGTVRKYEPKLLMWLVEQRDPSFRAGTRVEVTGGGGGPVQVEGRSASLAEVAELLVQVGALRAPLALPPAGEAGADAA